MSRKTVYQSVHGRAKCLPVSLSVSVSLLRLPRGQVAAFGSSAGEDLMSRSCHISRRRLWLLMVFWFFECRRLIRTPHKDRVPRALALSSNSEMGVGLSRSPLSVLSVCGGEASFIRAFPVILEGCALQAIVGFACFELSSGGLILPSVVLCPSSHIFLVLLFPPAFPQFPGQAVHPFEMLVLVYADRSRRFSSPFPPLVVSDSSTQGPPPSMSRTSRIQRPNSQFIGRTCP